MSSGSKTYKTTADDVPTGSKTSKRRAASSGSKTSKKATVSSGSKTSKKTMIPAGSKTSKKVMVPAKNKTTKKAIVPTKKYKTTADDSSVKKTAHKKPLMPAKIKTNKAEPVAEKDTDKRWCTGCRRTVTISVGKKQCEDCLARLRAHKAEKRKNDTTPICEAIRPATGLRCTNKVHKDKEIGGGKYCGLHRTNWQHEVKLKASGKKNARLCKGQYSCNPDDRNDKTKAILKDDEVTLCRSCALKSLNQNRKQIKEKRRLNEKLRETKSIYYKCIKCAVDKSYTIEKMGLNKNGTVTNYCKKCYDVVQAAQRKRIQKAASGNK